MEGWKTRLISLKGASDLRVSGLNDVRQPPDGSNIENNYAT